MGPAVLTFPHRACYARSQPCCPWPETTTRSATPRSTVSGTRTSGKDNKSLQRQSLPRAASTRWKSSVFSRRGLAVAGMGRMIVAEPGPEPAPLSCGRRWTYVASALYGALHSRIRVGARGRTHMGAAGMRTQGRQDPILPCTLRTAGDTD